MAARVLLVDDDIGVLRGLRRALGLEGYDVLSAEDGDAALRLAEAEIPDLVILDIVLPGIDGLEVCRRLRSFTTVPVLLLTARDTVPNRVEGLDTGADDYLVKPFALDELLARVRALLRRTRHQEEGILCYADVSLNLNTQEAFRAGTLLDLTPHQYGLLTTFLRHPRQVLSREQLCQSVWGYSFEGGSNFVDVAVKELRRRLEIPGTTRLIQTVRGTGYAFREA